MNRREFMAAMMAGGVVVAGELWMPGKKLISIPKVVEPNTVSFTVTGLEPGDAVYCYQIDAQGESLADVYDQVKYITRGTEAVFEAPPGEIIVQRRRSVMSYEKFTT